MHRLAVSKTDFGFGWMDIHVHQTGVNRQKQRKRRRDLIVQHIAIGLLNRVQHHFVAHKTLIDKEILRIRFPFGKSRLGHKTVQLQRAIFAGHR